MPATRGTTGVVERLQTFQSSTAPACLGACFMVRFCYGAGFRRSAPVLGGSDVETPSGVDSSSASGFFTLLRPGTGALRRRNFQIGAQMSSQGDQQVGRAEWGVFLVNSVSSPKQSFALALSGGSGGTFTFVPSVSRNGRSFFFGAPECAGFNLFRPIIQQG